MSKKSSMCPEDEAQTFREAMRDAQWLDPQRCVEDAPAALPKPVEKIPVKLLPKVTPTAATAPPKIPELNFKMAVKGIKPLHQDTRIPTANKPKPIAHQRKYEAEQLHEDMLSESYDIDDVEKSEEISYLSNGVQATVLKRLRKRYYNVEAELDLHGLVVVEAREEVSRFLRDCQLMGGGCVRIIHGKGYGSERKQPVLKNKVNKWLRQHDAVLAFCSARNADGGTGAVNVLVKNKC